MGGGRRKIESASAARASSTATGGGGSTGSIVVDRASSTTVPPSRSATDPVLAPLCGEPFLERRRCSGGPPRRPVDERSGQPGAVAAVARVGRPAEAGRIASESATGAESTVRWRSYLPAHHRRRVGSPCRRSLARKPSHSERSRITPRSRISSSARGARTGLRRLDRPPARSSTPSRAAAPRTAASRTVQGAEADTPMHAMMSPRPDPRARQGRRGRGRAPLLHGHAGPGALRSATSRTSSRARSSSPSRPTSSAAPRSATCRPRAPRRSRTRESSAFTTTSRRRRATTTRCRRRSATRAASARPGRRRPDSRPASAASSTWARRASSASRWRSSWRRSTPRACRSTCSTSPGHEVRRPRLHGPVEAVSGSRSSA